MPGMTQPAATRPGEDPLLGRPRPAGLLTAGVVALTAVVWFLSLVMLLSGYSDVRSITS